MRSISLLPPRHLAQTLAPLLARVNAGDEALSWHDFFDVVLTPAADLVLSAAAVGVFRRQVRAQEIELLGLLSLFCLVVLQGVIKIYFSLSF